MYKMDDVNRNGIVGPSRRQSFFYGAKDNYTVKLDSSHLSILRDNFGSKPYGSKLSVFSGQKDSFEAEERKDIQEKETLMVPF